MSLRARVGRLASRQRGVPCALCGGRPAPVVIKVNDWRKAAEPPLPPAPCPSCGTMPPTFRLEYVQDWRAIARP